MGVELFETPLRQEELSPHWTPGCHHRRYRDGLCPSPRRENRASQAWCVQSTTSRAQR